MRAEIVHPPSVVQFLHFLEVITIRAYPFADLRGFGLRCAWHAIRDFGFAYRIVSPHIGHSLAGIDFSRSGPYRTSSLMRGHMFRSFGGSLVATTHGDAGRDESSCFADEVIVDFPSVAPAVDRIRSAFLADEHQTPLPAAIRLSSRDALDGITVPVSVPVRCTCRWCGGRGESWTESCERCAGSGTEVIQHDLQVSVPAGVADGTRVQFTVTPPHNPPTRIELRIAVG